MTMRAFQRGDLVLSFGYPNLVLYANNEIVVMRRTSDGFVSIAVPSALAADQVPWENDGSGWRPMRAVGEQSRTQEG